MSLSLLQSFELQHTHMANITTAFCEIVIDQPRLLLSKLTLPKSPDSEHYTHKARTHT